MMSWNDVLETGVGVMKLAFLISWLLVACCVQALICVRIIALSYQALFKEKA